MAARKRRLIKKRIHHASMADKWEVQKICPTCVKKKVKRLMKAQLWGSQNYRVSCDECGHSFQCKSDFLDRSLGLATDDP